MFSKKVIDPLCKFKMVYFNRRIVKNSCALGPVENKRSSRSNNVQKDWAIGSLGYRICLTKK